MKVTMYVTLASALLGVFGCETIQRTLNVKKPSANLMGLSFEDITLKSATLLFDIEVENPYPVALPLLDMDYALASGANELLSGKADIQTTVPANDKKVVSLPAKVSYFDLVKAFMGIRPGSQIPYEATVGLSVDAPALGQVRLPLKKTGQLTVPAIPKADEIDWKKLLQDNVSQR